MLAKNTAAPFAFLATRNYHLSSRVALLKPAFAAAPVLLAAYFFPFMEQVLTCVSVSAQERTRTKSGIPGPRVPSSGSQKPRDEIALRLTWKAASITA